MEFNQREIAKFSEKDAKAYALYEQHLSKLTASHHTQPHHPLHCLSSLRLNSSVVSGASSHRFFEPFLDAAPLGGGGGVHESLAQLRVLRDVAQRAYRLGGAGLMDFHEMMTAPAERILSRWFESEPLKSTLATDAIIGAMTSPKSAQPSHTPPSCSTCDGPSSRTAAPLRCVCVGYRAAAMCCSTT